MAAAARREPISAGEAAEHGRRVAETYQRELQARYQAFSLAVRAIVVNALEADGIRVHQVQARAKTPESLAAKAAKLHPDESGRLRYPRPLEEIEDLAGVRIITYFTSDLDRVKEAVTNCAFRYAEGWAPRIKDDGLGYESWHCVLQLDHRRSSLVEYQQFQDLKCEVQARTILQHAWADIEHHVRYKSGVLVDVRAPFVRAKVAIDVADGYFDEVSRARAQALQEVEVDKELSTTALIPILDELAGPNDGSIRPDDGYRYIFDRLQQLGIATESELRRLFARYEVDDILRAVDDLDATQYQRVGRVLMANAGHIVRL